MLDLILTLSENSLAATTPVDATAAFFRAVSPYGATYLQTRAYQRPRGLLTSKNHWEAGGVIARHAQPGWIGSEAHKFICFTHNPLLEPIRRGLTRYRFSDFAPRARREHGDYWAAMGEGGISDALCATGYGHDRRIASIHLGFDRSEFEPGEAQAIQLAGMILVESFVAHVITSEKRDSLPKLSPRERDALHYVAEGKTDWEIGMIFGVAETTARFHVDNARRKLSGVNRAHAVARFLASDR
jgi:LuxR family transcriptional regulator, quorum-sensing system regulator BjaR1